MCVSMPYPAEVLLRTTLFSTSELSEPNKSGFSELVALYEEGPDAVRKEVGIELGLGGLDGRGGGGGTGVSGTTGYKLGAWDDTGALASSGRHGEAWRSECVLLRLRREWFGEEL